MSSVFVAPHAGIVFSSFYVSVPYGNNCFFFFPLKDQKMDTFEPVIAVIVNLEKLLKTDKPSETTFEFFNSLLKSMRAVRDAFANLDSDPIYLKYQEVEQNLRFNTLKVSQIQHVLFCDS